MSDDIVTKITFEISEDATISEMQNVLKDFLYAIGYAEKSIAEILPNDTRITSSCTCHD